MEVASLSLQQCTKIEEYGSRIGETMQKTIAIITDFVDWMSTQRFRYSQFREIGGKFDEVNP